MHGWDIIIKVWMEMWYVFTGSQSKQITWWHQAHTMFWFIPVCYWSWFYLPCAVQIVLSDKMSGCFTLVKTSYNVQSLISIFHTDLYRYGLFQIYLWNKQIWKAIPACVESLWWYFVGIPVEWKLGDEICAWFCVWKCGFPRLYCPDITALVDWA